jgi:hypothetical protein
MKKIILPNEFKDLEHFFNDLVYVIFEKENVEFPIKEIDTSKAPEQIWVKTNMDWRFLILLDMVYDTDEEVTVEYDLLIDWI